MSVGKLEISVYQLENDPTLEKRQLFSVSSSAQSTEFLNYTQKYSTLVGYDSVYGVVGRRMYGYNSSGQLTYTTVQRIDQSPKKLIINDWSNQIPANNTKVFMYYYPMKQYIKSEVTGLRGDYVGALVDGSMSGELQTESNRDFELRNDTLSFSLLESAIGSLPNFTPTAITNLYSSLKNFVYSIYVEADGVPQFWGYAKPEDIHYDPIRGIFDFECFGWMSLLADTQFNNILPYFTASERNNFNLDTLLKKFTKNFNGREIQTSLDQTVSYNDYQTLANAEDVTIGMVLAEIQKAYNCFLYYGADKKLYLVNRNGRDDLSLLNVHDSRVDAEVDESYALRDYERILINDNITVSQDQADLDYDDFNPDNYSTLSTLPNISLIWYNGTTFKRLRGITLNLDNMPDVAYLDLTQKLPDRSFTYYLFPERNAQDRIMDYADLLKPKRVMEATINTLNVEVGQKIINGSYVYSIKYINKNFTEGTSRIRGTVHV